MPTVTEYVAALPTAQREIADKLIHLISAAIPTESVWHGHPVWRLTPDSAPVCLLKAYSGHVTFGFWQGQRISDPSGRLEPNGSQRMASVKIRSTSDIDPDLFTTWLDQARELQ
jgi:hypothetical protein